jgi:hypothetical protein
MVYSGESANGVSYKDSWSISTYGYVHEETFQYKHFSERYGVPYDRDLQQYLEQSDLMQMLQSLKAAFFKVYCHLNSNAVPSSPAAATAATALAGSLTEATTPFQIFLTVQPDSAEMTNQNSSMQPHIDPAVLTINLHFSPLDYKGKARFSLL